MDLVLSHQLLVRFRPALFLALPLILSAYTHLWNPVGFPAIWVVEGQYMQRALQVLEGEGLHEPRSIFVHFYDHPFFGQLFLAGMLAATNYPSSHSSDVSSISVSSIETLYLVPRLFIGLLAVIDTFLVYRIAELRYNRNVALIASIRFAVLPSTWMLRKILLESLLLPLLLSSILIAIYYINKRSSNDLADEHSIGEINQKTKNDYFSVLLPLSSGIFLGLAIFTKTPILTMIPLVGYLILSCRGNRNWKSFGIWIVPVILIPLIWPTYALLTGEFHLWLEDIVWNLGRGDIQLDAAVSSILANSLRYLFQIDPVILVLGIAGIVYSEIKRDIFILLWVLPFIIFLFFVNFVSFFHLIPLLPLFCISAARMIVELSYRFKNTKTRDLLPFAIISAIGIFGLISTTMLITSNVTSSYFKVYSFLVLYLGNQVGLGNPEETTSKDDKISIVGRHWSQSFFWIPKYVFDVNLDFRKINEVDDIQVPVDNKERLLIIVDRSMKEWFSSSNTETANRTNDPSYFSRPIVTFEDRNPKYPYAYPYTSMSENRDIQWVQIREVNFSGRN
jgi:hypothetical protein